MVETVEILDGRNKADKSRGRVLSLAGFTGDVSDKEDRCNNNLLSSNNDRHKNIPMCTLPQYFMSALRPVIPS